MVRLPDAVVGDAYRSTFAWDTLVELVDVGNRMAGQAGEAEAAEILKRRLTEAGLDDARIEEFEIPGWWRGDSSITVSTPVEHRYEGDHEVIALPGTPAGTVEGRVVDVGYGTDEEFAKADVDGAIAMASSDVPDDHRWVHRMEKYAAAAEAGAVGFIFRNHVPGCVPPTGEVGYHNRPGPIPAVGVSKELGARLARYAEDGCEIELDVNCRNEPSTSHNVEAVVGPETDEEVLVTAHLDAHDIAEGANDNGAGSAIATEVGRLLAAAEGELDTQVRIVIFGAEEIGLYGAYHCAETSDLDRVKAVINVDGAGSSRNLRIGTNGFDRLAAVFEDVTEELDASLSTGDRVSPHGDQWAFVQEGVPAVFVSTESDSSGRGWGHTHADTLDKLDPRVLPDVAVQVAECAVEAGDPDRSFERRPREEIRDSLEDGYVRELKVGDRWPYDEVCR